MFSSIDELCRSAPEFSLMSVYIHPNIPQKKAINAIQSYGRDWVKPSDILVLVDDTVFGSAKDGFFLTRTNFFGHKSSGPIDNDIGDVYFSDNNIYIEDKLDDSYWKIKLDIGMKEKPIFAEYLNKCIKTLIHFREQENALHQAQKEKEAEEQQKREQELAKLEKERQQQLAAQNAAIEHQQKSRPHPKFCVNTYFNLTVLV